MRKNKFIKLIEHILVALPILMIVATTCYTIFNSNAKDSYSGASAYQEAQLKYQTNEINSPNDYVVGNYYLLEFNSISDGETLPETKVLWNDTGSTSTFKIEKLISLTALNEVDIMYIVTNDTYLYPSGADYLEFYTYTNNVILTSDTIIDETYLGIETQQVNITTYTTRLIIQFLSFDSFWNVNEVMSYLKELPLEYNEYISVETSITTLDKAFENAMGEFNNLGFDKINFTGFFEDIFFEGQPNVYLSFVNCYLNYMLLIECAFVLPLVLYWFIHVGESILYRFEKGEW